MGYLHEFRGITGPHMVVAPKSTLGNWMKEIARFCPILRAVKFLGNPEERVSLTPMFLNYYCYFSWHVTYISVLFGQNHIREKLLQPGKFDVCVTSFEMAIKEKTALRRFSWRYIIIDEAHRIKNENSLLSKTMRLFSTNYRLLITGTPLQVGYVWQCCFFVYYIIHYLLKLLNILIYIPQSYFQFYHLLKFNIAE
jgi:SWI/SNF-related matrix-associated actin-dependent regulator of chromatin subfamily A member 5